jgi:hypothetical protein
MRVNICPEVMTRDTLMVPTAHVHLFCRIGAMKRRATRKTRLDAANVPQRAQLMGALYGIGMGVWIESCSARGWASNPLFDRVIRYGSG